ncbi:Hypothetical predicted protein [Paramuricea clavata]|uniref:Uncharacterized protein n=1 Tax=Paramuricea clavata TaxID=317549 RepID=A0A7D9DSP6_PARCT|nr:Hypothetical predicted protein [Paramuricea clavata]
MKFVPFTDESRASLDGPDDWAKACVFNGGTYCPFLKNSLEPWLDNLPLATLKKIIFMHDNAPSHAAKATTQFLHSLGFVNETLMVWPPNSPDLIPIEIIKRHIYVNDKQYLSKHDLWMAIKELAATIPKSTIEKLTDSVNDRLFEVIERQGAC